MPVVYQSHFHQTSVGQIHYETLDHFDEAKPSALFIHGAHRTLQKAEFWHPLTDKIQEMFNPIYVDLLGHGKSEFTESDQRIPADKQIIALLELLLEIQTTRAIGSLVVFGRSYGGYLALRLADELQHRVNGLFLIAPAVSSEIISVLTGWKNPVYCFWDSKDPVVNISNFSYIVSSLAHAKLFSVGPPASFNTFSKYKVFERPDVAGTHIPEIEFKDYFIEAVSEFYEDVMSISIPG